MESKQAAIYHFTNGIQRAYVCDNEVQRLKQFAHEKGFENLDVYCDIRTTSEEHEALDDLFAKRDQYSAIIAKDYFHINKYILQVANIIKELDQSEISIYTMNDKSISISNSAPISKPLKAVTYNCHWCRHPDSENVALKNDILRVFIESQTNWILIDQYNDEEQKGHAGKQPQLKRLIEEKNNYDIVLVHNLSSIHWRTHNLCETIELLKKDIYSLLEGYLQYME